MSIEKNLQKNIMKVVTKEDRFIISSCMALAEGFEEDVSDVRECIRNLKEVGCNLAEFMWADPKATEKCILACEEFGIDGIFQNWDAFGGFQARKGDFKINYEELERFMEFGKKYKHFYGYYVWDEPLSEESVNAAGEQLDVIEKLDPKRLPFTVAIPSYNATDTWDNGKFEDYLIRYAKVVNPPVMSLDYYPFSAMRPEPFNQLDDKQLFLDIALLRKLALEMDAPMWFYIQALDSPKNETYYRFSPERLTMQAYNVLLHGGKAVQYYCTVANGFVTYLSSRISGAWLFPCVLGGSMVLVMLFSIVVLREKINKWGKMGVAVGLAAMIIMNIM